MLTLIFCFGMLKKVIIMKKFLVIVDIQYDFVDGALGTAEAQKIIKPAVDKIKNFDGEIFVTYDTHSKDYLNTAEGKKLPVAHCIKDTSGWRLNGEIAAALEGKKYTEVIKYTFGSKDLPQILLDAASGEEFSVELIGLCTDICVVSNALYLKANFPEFDISVDSACCAGVTPETHNAALDTMRCCQIDVK